MCAMVDYAKKLRKSVGDDFEAGEEILDARIVQPAGTAFRQAMAGGAFAQFGSGAKILVERYNAQHDNAERSRLDDQGGMAAALPTKKCYFTLTDRRVMMHSFGTMSGAPKELLVSHPLTDFAGMDAAKGKLVSKLTLWFVDGSTMTFDVFKGGGDPADLVASFNQAIERTAAT